MSLPTQTKNVGVGESLIDCCDLGCKPREREGGRIGYLKSVVAEGPFSNRVLAPKATGRDFQVAKTGKSVLNPSQLLESALDMMVDAAVLPRNVDQEQNTLLVCSSRIGVSVIEGTLDPILSREVHALTERLLLRVEKGSRDRRVKFMRSES